MQIAVLGWGSLIWCPGSLQIKTKWRSDGPILPIEFARISEDGRLTLVIHPCSREIQTYWAISAFDKLEEARENLYKREGTVKEKIDVAIANDNGVTEDMPGQTVLSWLKSQQNVEAAVWTALGSNWKKKRGQDFNLNDAECYLSDLKHKEGDEATLSYARACEYIRNAPAQIRTDLRNILREKEDFKTATLSEVLFEPR